MADKQPHLPSLQQAIGHAKNGGHLPSLEDALKHAKAAAPVQHHSRHGVGGFLHNLGADVVHTVAGIPAGLVQTAEHPVRTVENVGKVYAQTYGPLTHGDVSGFLHNLYTHPLGPILDAATVLTGGAALGAKLGVLSSEPAMLALRSSEEFAAGKAGTVGKLTSHNPFIRGRQRLIHDLQNKLPFDAPHIGEAARHARMAERLPRREAAALQRSKEFRAYNKAIRALTGEETVALHLVGNDLHPADYAAALRKLQADGQQVEPAMFKVLENPKVFAAFDHPDAKMQAAIDAADALSQLDAKIKIQHGLLDPQTAADRVGLNRLRAEGILGGGGLRPTPDRPFYVPDVMASKEPANAGFGKQGAGKSQPKNIVFENNGTLFRTGQLLLNHDILSNTFLNTVKYGLADDLHATLMKYAARMSKQDLQMRGLPKGWDFIPKTVVSKSGAKRAQQIGRVERNKGAALQQMESLFDADEQLYGTFTVRDRSAAAQLHGDYLIVPKSVVQQIAGEYTKSSGVIRQFLDKPFKVWRALVLGFRVGFLTNNLVGNHLLYAIQAAGPTGLSAYLNAVKRVHGESMVRSLIQMKGIPDPLRRQFMEEFFPEQVEGTFGGTQTPRIKSQKLKKVARMSTGLAPATQAVAEGTLRRALVETFIRKSPQFKQVWHNLPRQTRDFEDAAAQLLRGQHGDAYQARISEQVNNALGDYLNMGKVEQDVLRQVMPFYAWYRAIVRITAHLVADTPGRTNVLVKLGQIGDVSNKDMLGPLPDYLLNLIPVGHGDHPTVLASKGMNPFATINDLGSGAAGLLTGHPGDTGKAFTELGPNPFLLATIQNLSGKNLFTGGDLHGSGGLAGQVVSQTARQLPQVTLIKALLGHGNKSKLYGKQSGAAALEQFSGVPLKRLDKARANRAANR